MIIVTVDQTVRAFIRFIFRVDWDGVLIVRTLSGRSYIYFRYGSTHFQFFRIYDLRFPQLFRRQSGIDCFLLPAAFTTNTGKAHWEVLLRARAIENLSYVVSAAQAGRSSCGRAFWGHSCAVDPWGTVISKLNGHETGVCFADVDPAFLRQVRALLPALNNRVEYDK